ncbi:MAG: hypothetical protein UW92_C0010G0006 [Candidatus Jorgensenbacteria bacterium GW2011_GWA2_45_13]|uniref:DUF8128 domain-containing protein n=1 Tax=Candidatus Jorgensenbacteria bacterium GW2011_GWA2_45_13 TaxID=1618662 RepID=A0A0G1NEN6_9BACT|nr:MAG: hypothetical protein UW92_C0010G0006 [Candidatus Jorgensenbacteria bacterium GW2011_GWA2_45_13]
MIKNVIDEIGSIIIEFFKKEEAWIMLIFLSVGSLVFISIPEISFGNIWNRVLYFLSLTWSVWLFLVLFPFMRDVWLHWRQEQFEHSLQFVLLELRLPREIQKSPQAMEQVLSAMHSLRNFPSNFREKYIAGEVTVPFTLEMLSFSGEVHFYIRCQKKQRNLVEAAIFSYYQDVEVSEVEDYVEKLPKNVEEMYREDKNMWGTEMVLSKEAAYPIKTYPNFESEAEDRQFDPMSSFIEVLGKLNRGEIVGIQFIIAPAGNDWGKKWEGLVESLQEPKTTEVELEEGGTRKVPIARSPGEYDILEAVEKNLSKPAFDTIIRFIYIAPNETYYDSFARRGLVGAFNQYATLNLNSLRQNFRVSTRTQIWYWPHLFPKVRNEFKKERLLHKYRERKIPPETWVGRFITSKFFNLNFASERFAINVEGMATLFHMPTASVLTAPHINRSESKKGGPPAGLTIFGEEEEINKFY